MTRVIRRAAALVVWMAGAVVVVTPAMALASCVEPPPLAEAIAQAETVFVGTVIDLDFDDRLATFGVIEVWKGELGSEVVVNGGPSLEEMAAARTQGMSLATSADRSYLLGENYLVVSYSNSGEVLVDNACSNTRLMTEDVEALRPDSAYSPVAAPESPATPDTDSGLGWITPVLSIAAVVAVAGVVHYRRRPNPDIW